jgi:hypothetical protein
MSIYEIYTEEQVEELLSNYLIDSWSYSKVSQFARNEKAFEKQYIYREADRSSASAASGQAYHRALEIFFYELKSGKVIDIIDLQQIAFLFIEGIDANRWKIQKTTPTVEECKQKAISDVSKLLTNFMSEIQVYTDEIKGIIATEHRIDTWVTVNGVDIPLPLHCIIDLVVTSREEKTIIIDHKSRAAFTDEKTMQYSIGKQAITYVLAYESENPGKTVDEVWFIENKISKNKDGSRQIIPFKVKMDSDTRRIYEALLYENLSRMIKAVSDPDYTYMINDDDNFTDRNELYDFWIKTMMAEVEDFQIPESKKPAIRARLRKIRDAGIKSVSPSVIKKFKTYTEQFIPYDYSNKNMTDEQKIEHSLRTFGIPVRVAHILPGYSSISYLLEISAGTPISGISRYRLDLANALDVSNIRIGKELTVFEEKAYLQVEVSRKASEILKWDATRLSGHKIPIGIDNFNKVIYWDLDNHSTPHMLVCGATGSGKSVCLKSTIEYAIAAGVRNIYVLDPKYEFTKYRAKGVEVINEIEEIETQIELLVLEMQERVKLGVSDKKTLVIFDEFADAVANSRKGKELKNSGSKSLEENMRILLQKGRSSGFRIIAATQRASTKVITGDAKVNYPVQICFRVPKEIDSMVVIDESGAESLNGYGDGLIKSPEYFGVVRFQGFYKD